MPYWVFALVVVLSFFLACAYVEWRSGEWERQERLRKAPR